MASAVEADKLDGKDAAELQTSSAYVEETDADPSLTGTPQEILSTTVTTTGTRIIATASVEFENDSGDASNSAGCELFIAGENSPNYDQKVQDSGDDVTLAFTFASTVSAGTHPVVLECEENSGEVGVNNAGLSAIAVGE